MASVQAIMKEHREIKEIFDKLEKIIPLESQINVVEVKAILSKFEKIWNVHESDEEKVFSQMKKEGKIDFKNEKAIVDEHKQLRGHWKVLTNAISSANPMNVWVSLDTDGRMIMEKFREHMAYEESFLRSIKK